MFCALCFPHEENAIRTRVDLETLVGGKQQKTTKNVNRRFFKTLRPSTLNTRHNAVVYTVGSREYKVEYKIRLRAQFYYCAHDRQRSRV